MGWGLEDGVFAFSSSISFSCSTMGGTGVLGKVVVGMSGVWEAEGRERGWDAERFISGLVLLIEIFLIFFWWRRSGQSKEDWDFSCVFLSLSRVARWGGFFFVQPDRFFLLVIVD